MTVGHLTDQISAAALLDNVLKAQWLLEDRGLSRRPI